MPRCLTVIEGADAKRVFPLPDLGKIAIGKGPAHCDISFNDFYLEKMHCTLQIQEGSVTVTDLSRERGVFVNGKKVITKTGLSEGDVLRVGNTYLRMDPYDGPPPETPSADEERVTVPRLPLKRMMDLQGHTLGHFELGLVLGKSHHGIVFRARDLKTNRTVALKVLAPEFPATNDEVKQFAQAIKSLAALADHPNLVRWWGTGKSGPYVWIAQELVDGDNLNSIFSQPESARWSWRGAWRLAWEVGQALDHLARRHVAHGNITAANLLVANDGMVKLNDLRFREAIDGSVLQHQQLEPKLLDELPYCAPERLEPEAFVDEHVADIYSLGVATYVRMSCGSAPFQGSTPEETIDLILAGATDKHRRRAPAAPEDFLDVVYKMIARNQEDRYQTAAQALSDLAHFKEKA